MGKGIKTKKASWLYRFLASIIAFFYRKKEFIGVENIPETPTIIVGNHAQIHGPLACELFFPRKKYIWCIGNMMHLKEVPSYAYKDFWSMKPKWIRWFFKIVSYLIAPLSVFVFKNADVIGVYKDTRLLKTYRETVDKLNEGANIIIFPESEKEYNDIVSEFQDKYIDVAKLYYNKYKVCVAFVPMYNAARIRKIAIGEPIYYDPNLNIEEQRIIINNYLKEQITIIAKDMPKHKVVPYLNVSKRKEKYNK